jgi:hypothetical protein
MVIQTGAEGKDNLAAIGWKAEWGGNRVEKRDSWGGKAGMGGAQHRRLPLLSLPPACTNTTETNAQPRILLQLSPKATPRLASLRRPENTSGPNVVFL